MSLNLGPRLELLANSPSTLCVLIPAQINVTATCRREGLAPRYLLVKLELDFMYRIQKRNLNGTRVQISSRLGLQFGGICIAMTTIR